MLFWILFPCNLLTLVIMHFTLVPLAKPSGRLILGVNIPVEHIRDEKITLIADEFRKSSKKIFWLLFIFQFLLFPIREFVSLSTLFIFVYIFLVVGVYSICLGRYSKKITEIKKQNSWLVGEAHILNIDTEVSRLKNTFPVSRKWFIAPAIINSLIIGIYIKSDNFENLLPVIISTAVIFTSGYILYELFVRVRTVTYSEKTEINLALNKAYKHEWSKFTVAVSYSSVIFLPLLFSIDKAGNLNNSFMYSIFIVTIISSSLTIFLMLYTHKKVKDLRSKLLSFNDEIICEDEDEYWKYGCYSNPHDKRVWVEKRVGVGLSINMGSTAGKIMMLVTAAILLGCVWLCLSLIPVDFGNVEMIQNGDTYSISAPMYSTRIKSQDIISVKTIDKFPPSFRTNGVNSSRLYAGNFNVKGYGKSKVYIMYRVPLYIAVELADGSYIFINGVDIETTEEYYNQLIYAH